MDLSRCLIRSKRTHNRIAAVYGRCPAARGGGDAVGPATPWIGLSSLRWARLTGQIVANIETRLGEEVSAPVGTLLPIPWDGGDGDEDDDPLADLKTELKRLRGNVALAETTSAGWGEGLGSAPQSDGQPRRMGREPARSDAKSLWRINPGSLERLPRSGESGNGRRWDRGTRGVATPRYGRVRTRSENCRLRIRAQARRTGLGFRFQ